MSDKRKIPYYLMPQDYDFRFRFQYNGKEYDIDLVKLIEKYDEEGTLGIEDRKLIKQIYREADKIFKNTKKKVLKYTLIGSLFLGFITQFDSISNSQSFIEGITTLFMSALAWAILIYSVLYVKFLVKDRKTVMVFKKIAEDILNGVEIIR